MSEARIEVTAFRMVGPAGGEVTITRAREARGWQVKPERLPGLGVEADALGVFVSGEDAAPAQHVGALLLEKVEACFELDRQLSDARAEVYAVANSLQQDQRLGAVER